MTPKVLLKELVAVVEDCTKNLRFVDSFGDAIPISVFEQNLPVKQNDSDDEPYPYIIVRVVEGKLNPNEGSRIIHVWIVIGIVENDLKNQGGEEVSMIEEIIGMRLCEQNVLQHFRLAGPIAWGIEDTDTYPYFYGGMEMDFETHQVQNADRIAERYT